MIVCIGLYGQELRKLGQWLWALKAGLSLYICKSRYPSRLSGPWLSHCQGSRSLSYYLTLITNINVITNINARVLQLRTDNCCSQAVVLVVLLVHKQRSAKRSPSTPLFLLIYRTETRRIPSYAHIICAEILQNAMPLRS